MAIAFDRAARTRVRIRPARVSELHEVVRTLAAAFGEPLRADTWEWLKRSGHGEVVVAERNGSIVGTGSGLSFGGTGWIGGIGVEPRARRIGLASALTETVAEWLRGRGARTLLLQATAQGRPVYEGIGFLQEEMYRMWSVPPLFGRRPHPAKARPLRRGDFDAVLALDRAVTGEERDAALRAAWASGGVAMVIDDELRGFHLDTPWGPGPTIAVDEHSGVALIRAAQRTDVAMRVGVPAGNRAGTRELERRGFAEVAPTLRMRLGPPLAWSPQSVYGVFNPFWG